MDGKYAILSRERDEAVSAANRYLRLLAFAVQNYAGGQMVLIAEDEVETPILTICGNVVTTRPVVRVYPAVEGTHLGMGDE